MHARSCLIHGINGLVGETAVGNIPVGQSDACQQRFIRICDIVVVLVTLLYVLEDVVCVLGRCGLHDNFLETSLKCAVLLYRLAVLVDCGSADALYLSSGKGRLKDVRGIH